MKQGRWLVAVVVATMAVPEMASAYIGPGAGLGALGALLAVVGSVLMAIGIVLYWPFRLLIRRVRAAWPSGKRADAQGTQGPPARSSGRSDP